jgi:hypothetical protein
MVITDGAPTGAPTTALYEPTQRDEKYKGNWAQYILDAHNARATFNFCGGMMFQLVLSKRLKKHLKHVVDTNTLSLQPVVQDASIRKMQHMPNYSQSSMVDNVHYFHGREIRNVKDAAGGMGFVLYLSHFDGEDDECSIEDNEGWSKEERKDYNGWGHDSNRPWRNLEKWESEGVRGFRDQFGSSVYGLHHRMYWHVDNTNRLWLSAEDGCEGFAMDV